MGTINEDVSLILQNSFQSKIPPWIRKMFNKMVQIYLLTVREKRRECSTQTQNWESELKETKKENKKLKTLIEDLKGEIKQHIAYEGRLSNLIKENSLADFKNSKSLAMDSEPKTTINLAETSEEKKILRQSIRLTGKGIEKDE